jgi:hypothetical protein
VNAAPAYRGKAANKAQAQFLRGCDGGILFWGIEYDLRSKAFLNFATNSALGDPLEGLKL